jgi:hypothetical protein
MCSLKSCKAASSFVRGLVGMLGRGLGVLGVVDSGKCWRARRRRRRSFGRASSGRLNLMKFDSS